MEPEKIINHYGDARLTLLEMSINNINDTLVRFEKKLDKIDNKMDSNLKWTLCIISTMLFSLLVVIASGFHWI